MDIVLVGADIEENLGIGMIAAAARRAGAEVSVLSLDRPDKISATAREIVARRPAVLGLSVQFQQRARELLKLAEIVRALGFEGHITAGGFFATLAFEQMLGGSPELDSVALHEGEETMVDLWRALRGGTPLGEVPGIAWRGEDGEIYRTGGRPLARDLDALPFAARHRAPAKHLGVPFIPMVGSRGCWGACSFCSIASYTDGAIEAGGKSPRVRLRSPENIAGEMAALWHAAGGKAVFCFHDANFLLPRPEASLRRLRRIRDLLQEEHGVDRYGLVGNARPDCITDELCLELRELGVLWLYVGVENASRLGARHLGRDMPADRVHQALDACRRAGIFACYNLLMFEPQTTTADLEENIAFIRQHPSCPSSFRRAEPYVGTPIHQRLAAQGRLRGDYLGQEYDFDDPRVDLAYRISAGAFRFRNYTKGGVHTRTMRLGYRTNLLDFYYPDDGPRNAELARRGEELIRDVSMDTARFLTETLEAARGLEPGDEHGVQQQIDAMVARMEPADEAFVRRLDRISDDIALTYRSAAPAPRRSRLWRQARRLAQGVAVASLIAAPVVAGSGCSDPVPDKDAGVDHGLLDDAAQPDLRDAGVEYGLDDAAQPQMDIADFSLLDDAAPPPVDMPDFSVVDDAAQPDMADFSLLDDAAPPPDTKKQDK